MNSKTSLICAVAVCFVLLVSSSNALPTSPDMELSERDVSKEAGR